MDKLPDIVIISQHDFGTRWYQRQAFAVCFAKAGHRVFYFNKTPQRWSHPAVIVRWLVGRSKKTALKDLPGKLNIVSLFCLMPTEKLRFVNRKLISKKLKGLGIENPIVITSVPSYNCVEIIEQLRPQKVVYVNVENYEGRNRIVKALFDSEKAIVQQADMLFADSEFNVDRVEKKSDSRKVLRSLPGVDFELFRKSLRGDEDRKEKAIYFFGVVHDMVDIKLYNRLAESYRVVFVGEVIDNVKKLVSRNIEKIESVSQKRLAELLKDADIIGLFYEPNHYIKGVIPAKIFESLATGKPVIVSGLGQDPIYSKYVYQIDGTIKSALETIRNLGDTETQEKIKARQVLAAEADWSKRFGEFADNIFTQKLSLPKFSVLMSVYEKDDANYFSQAFDSIVNQSAGPDEIVLVKDGPVSSEVESLIEKYKAQFGESLKIVSIEQNAGLGNALAEGLVQCSFELVARMDADDVSSPDRFEKQLAFMQNNPSVGVVSCFAAAFIEKIDEPIFVRRGPLLSERIEKQFRYRFCMNHPAAMMRKQVVFDAGNYRQFDGLEDYHLWARMLLNGTKMANIAQVLYYHRWQEQLLKRRSGIKRARQQIKLQREFLRIGFVSKFQLVRNVVIRSLAAVLPAGIIRRVRIFLGI